MSEDLFVSRTGSRLWAICGIGGGRDYCYVIIDPVSVEAQVPPNDDKSETFDVKVEIWKFGEGGTIPPGCVCKKEEHLCYLDCDFTKEAKCTDCATSSQKQITFVGAVSLSLECISGMNLYKDGWDGTVEITGGEGLIENICIKTNDGSHLTFAGAVLIEASILL